MDLMDRQKTIELLEELKTKDPFDRYEKQNIGIDWAIDAVKAASSVLTCEDAVSRQQAIDRINKQREHLEPDVYPQDKIGDAAYRICAEFIERLPAVQSQGSIRCKDCKWCEDADGSMCKNPASWVVATDRDFGCVLAERRTDGSD